MTEEQNKALEEEKAAYCRLRDAKYEDDSFKIDMRILERSALADRLQQVVKAVSSLREASPAETD